MNNIILNKDKVLFTGFRYINHTKTIIEGTWQLVDPQLSWEGCLPGQYYVFICEKDGNLYKRNYSVSGYGSNREIQTIISILWDKPDAISRWLTTNEALEQIFYATGPCGNFYLREYINPSAVKLLFAVSGSAWGTICVMQDQLEMLAKHGAIITIHLSVNSLADVPDSWEKIRELLSGFNTKLILTLYSEKEKIVDKIGLHDAEYADVYLCGNPIMIEEVESKCIAAKAHNIYKEEYFKKVQLNQP